MKSKSITTLKNVSEQRVSFFTQALCFVKLTEYSSRGSHEGIESFFSFFVHVATVGSWSDVATSSSVPLH